ncbi:MAG: hypothetical protein IPP19_08510 [Verrucomicrobia bacterium]|nr:hypothetical protein [Verrucomicrobiota bacterium]
MISSLRKFISWLFLKLAFGAFIAVSGLAIHGLWLFLHDDQDFAKVHATHLAALKEQHLVITAARDVGRQEHADLQQKLAAQQERTTRAATLAADLRADETWWVKLWGDRDQRRINAGRIERLEQMARESKQAASELKRELTRIAVALNTHEAELKRVGSQLFIAEETDSRVVYYANAAWLAGRWFILGALCLYFFGPTLFQLVLFYRIAPGIARGRAVQLDGGPAVSPWLSEARTMVDVALWSGERARVRKRYLKSVDVGLAHEPRLLLSWRFPLTSLLSGFVHDENLRNSRAGRSLSLVFAHHKNPENQMAVVHVPEGGSLVVRPSFLAGVILPPGQELQMRPRWQLFRWQAWVTGQLRFLELIGPCRLVVAGRPGLRVERLTVGEDGILPVRRTSLDKTVAFTPNLEYRLIRTARFWNYYRWNHRLFDAHFTGVGFVLTQTTLPGRRTGIWSVTRNRARKLIGL